MIRNYNILVYFGVEEFGKVEGEETEGRVKGVERIYWGKYKFVV